MKKLKEIVIKTPSESLSPEIVNSIKTIVVEFIVEQLKFAANSYLKRTANIVDYYLQPDVLDVFTSFITDQMIFNNYEVFKNGNEILVSHNNRNMINEEDIRDYIESNPELQSYLRQLLYTFYQKNVDVGCLTKAALQQAYKDQRYFKKEEDAYDSSDVLLTVEYAMENNDCNYYGFPDVIEDNDFNGFLTQEFNKADVIKEIKVVPPKPKFPLKVTYDTYDDIAKRLTKLGYTWITGKPIERMNPWRDSSLRKNSAGRWIEGKLEKDIVGYLVVNVTQPNIIQFLNDPNEAVLAHYVEEYKKFGIQEIKVQPSILLPMVDLETGNDGDEHYVLNYENVLKNLKGFKHIIAKHLGVPVSPELNNFLVFYISQLQEMEHQGEEEVYANITFQEFLNDIKSVYEYSSPEDWVYDPNYDIYSAEDLQEIKVQPYTFPIKATYKTYDTIAKQLTAMGYTWATGKSIESHNPYKRSYNTLANDKIGYFIPQEQDPRTLAFVIEPNEESVKFKYGIQEIKVQPGYNFNNTQPLKGEAKIETDYFREGYLMYLVDLGSYYTFMPHGDQQLVILIPKQYIEVTDMSDAGYATERHVKAGIDNIKNLISQNKIEMAKPTQTESVKSFKDLLLESYQKKVKSIIKEHTQPLLQEYSENTIKKLLNKWGIDPETDLNKANIAKTLIKRFEDVKDSLPSKKDILAIPDELKNKDIKNIEIYSFEELEKLIRSLPENPEKKKKEAIEKFVKNELIDKQTAQSYVARFMKNIDNLKYAVSNGLEDRAFTKEEVKELIPSRLLNNDAYLDPRNWRWASFEQMLDALFPSQKKAEGETNLAETDADKIYSGNGIEIYKGDDVHKCISYNPVSGVTGKKKYGWCVTQVGNTNYDYYRFRDAAPTFYFIFDRSKDSSPEHSPFVDKWHAFVIQVTADQQTYIVTDAENRGDIATKTGEGWEGIAKIMPADTWAKIKNLKDYFKPISLSSPERARKMASGKNLSLQEFKELSQDEKILYVQGKAQKNQLTPEILKILPQYKISYDGRSTTLANVAIDSGQRYKYDDLKNYEALAKRYAIFRFRHTDYGKEPISLPFVKYLDEEAQQKYLETFDGNLTFEYIDKYFGEKAARNYVETQAKDLKFLPPSAVKYIQSPNLKKFYELFFKLSTPWRYSSETNIDEKDLGNLTSMPTQVVTPVPIDKEQWIKLSPAERKTVIDLTEKFNGDSKYEELLYALPIIVKDGNKKYVILPENNTDDFYAGGNWLIMDEQGNVVKNDISGSSSLGDLSLISWYPSESNEYKKVYDINDLKVA
jgi:hypothetical protein